MQSATQAVLLSWAIPPAATFALVLSALIYLRGWWLLRRAGSRNIPPWRAAMFLLGLSTLWVALASPMDVFNGFVLTAHMLQHMLLMMIAPPLILLGAPLVPLVRGLPIFAAREFAGPFLNWSVAKRVGSLLTSPVFALILMGFVMFAWHTPALYELALRSPAWHQTEHACFLIASLIFWWPVVQPWPSRSQWPRWAMVPYLLIADLQNTALSAILVFSDRVLYPSYSTAPRLFRFSALEDQVAAGSIMWVVGSLAFIVPAIVIAVQCLSKRSSPAPADLSRRREASSFDALHTRLPGFFPSSDFATARWSSASREVATFLALFAVTALCFIGLLALSSNDDDDQAVRFQGTSGPFAVAVLAPPGDVPAGSSVFSVLVQDLDMQDVLLDATVDIAAQPSSSPPHLPITVTANHARSANKLLQSAELNLPVVGDWTLSVAVRRNADTGEFVVPLHVVKPATDAEFPWSYVIIGTVALILFGAYFGRRRSRHAERPVQV